jgi:hypothetical protein
MDNLYHSSFKTSKIEIMVDNAILIARVCHAANQAWREGIGQIPSGNWDSLSGEHQKGIITGVRDVLDGKIKSAEHNHEQWVAAKQALGWKEEEHPCMKEFKSLPLHEQIKDYLFIAIIKTIQARIKSSQPDAVKLSDENSCLIIGDKHEQEVYMMNMSEINPTVVIGIIEHIGAAQKTRMVKKINLLDVANAL